MNKQEFIELAGIDWDDISDDDYSTIEYVYSRHPSIQTKQDIVNLWKSYGMTVIVDMINTATLYEQIERNYFMYMNKMDEARKAMKNIKEGRIGKAKEYLDKYWKEEFPEE